MLKPANLLIFGQKKEIYTQPDTIWASLNSGGRLYSDHNQWKVKLGGLERAKHKFKNAKHLILVGCGTSLHAALFTLPMFRHYGTFTTVQVMDASEFTIQDLPNEFSIIVLISQSGETKDCHRVLEAVSDKFATVGIVNVVDSLISRETDCGIYLNAGREVGVAATKSFTSQCVVLQLLALWFAQESCRSIEKPAMSLFGLSSGFQEHMEIVDKFVDRLLPTMKSVTNLFILGKGPGHAISLEAALKIKEIAYIHAEGYPAASMKHGSFALLDPSKDTPVFINVFKGPNESFMLNCVEQITSRDVRTVIITNDSKLEQEGPYPNSFVLVIKEKDEMTAALISVLFYQILALRLSISKGFNPDFPRNLAKTVTVD